MLTPNLLTVHADVEHAARTFDERRVGLERLLNRIRQTGGSWQVVSLTAVFDFDLHLVPYW